jgi:glycosyltransferase involved in cell wall biosynthesis
MEQLDLMHFPYFSHPVTYHGPFVITIHDLIMYYFSTGKASTLPFPLYQLKRQAFSFVLEHGINHAQKIIVPLQTVKEDMQQTFMIPEERIVVTREGFDKNFSRQSTKNDQRPKDYFLYVGNAYPHKNIPRLLEGFFRFYKENSEYRLILVGKKDYFYERLERSLSTQEKEALVFSHDVTDAELAQLYQSAKALVSASLMEGFGLPPLEAMALSTPVLVSDIPSFKEVCGEVAYYFDPRNPEDIAAAMQALTTEPERVLSKRLQNGRDRAHQFSWKKMAEETLAIYQEAMA